MGSSVEPCPPRLHRTVQLIGPTFSSHFWTYVEEQLYAQALQILASNLTPSSSPNSTRPLSLPSPHHLSLLATLVVHPSLTTRTTSVDKHASADNSLRLLRLVCSLAGPLAPNFAQAFQFIQFTQHGKTRSGGRNQRIINGSANELTLGRSGSSRSLSSKIRGPTRVELVQEEDDYTPPASIDIVNAGAVWACGEDFWHVTGWAFNCSVNHSNRWERWGPWMQLMCDILEDDWKHRVSDKSALAEGEDIDQAEQSEAAESLILQYITHASGGSGKVRRIIRAIFADGSSKSENEFREVFRSERKGPKKQGDAVLKKREVDVDIEAEIYGDYLANNSENTSDEEPQITNSTRPSRRRAAKEKPIKQEPEADGDMMNGSKQHAGENLTLGDHLSQTIRVRLLNLLSSVSSYRPSTFTSLDDLYALFTEFIRPLSLPTFSAFVLPSTVHPHFAPDAHTTLCEYLLHILIDSASPVTDEAYLTQAKLEECYLPYAANGTSVVENAKVSLLVESLLRHMALQGKLEPGERLKKAVENGIGARENKIGIGTGKKRVGKGDGNVEEAWMVMWESGERMRDLVGCL